MAATCCNLLQHGCLISVEHRRRYTAGVRSKYLLSHVLIIMSENYRHLHKKTTEYKLISRLDEFTSSQRFGYVSAQLWVSRVVLTPLPTRCKQTLIGTASIFKKLRCRPHELLTCRAPTNSDIWNKIGPYPRWCMMGTTIKQSR